jgi:hypothetical protein
MTKQYKISGTSLKDQACESRKGGVQAKGIENISNKI